MTTTNTTLKKINVYDIVTARVIEAMERGINPWRKPWTGGVDGEPRNAITHKPYRGVNVLMLGLTALTKGYASNHWLTFRQAAERKGNVRKGEKGTPVTFWKFSERREKDKSTGETEVKKQAMVRYYTVFNTEQCENLCLPVVPIDPANIRVNTPIEKCVEVWTGWAEKPELKVGSVASYSPVLDYITMPAIEKFDTSEHYYATLFHEAVHATGNKRRLNRQSLTEANTFGNYSYAKEELVAEIGSAFLCALTEINKPEITDNTGAYLRNWIKALQNDHKLILSAASQAQKAVDYIRGIRYSPVITNNESDEQAGESQTAEEL